MKSFKPGRGPSALSGIGSIVAVLFGIFWTVMAFSITRGAPGPISLIFPLFGVLFILTGIVQAVYHFKNASGRNRMSLFDIVDSREEPDPLDRFVSDRYPQERPADAGWRTAQSSADPNRADPEHGASPESDSRPAPDRKFEGSYCPFCGGKLREDFRFCPHCGKEI
ncbi:zinc-ribbon domain-containing protein [Gorillibacterium sp. sgz500922]|uniref:zinc-ribbon domain-containing protein n=1 Tax=Gorillibacterium sp. sgz500922 TaxID=3446694 RepID=UPI003F6766AA